MMQRYVPSKCGDEMWMAEYTKGQWARYEDAAALESENAALRDRIAELEEVTVFERNGNRVVLHGEPIKEV